MTRDEIESILAAETQDSMNAAFEEFSNECGQDIRRGHDFFVPEFNRRLDCIIKGEAPGDLGPYDRDELARFLTTAPYVEYIAYELPKGMDDAAIAAVKNPLAVAEESPFTAKANEFDLWIDTLHAIAEYLVYGAGRAYRLGATRTMRLFLAALRIAESVLPQPLPFFGDNLARRQRKAFFAQHIAPDDAKRLVALEKVATEQLWIDFAAHDLKNAAEELDREELEKLLSSGEV